MTTNLVTKVFKLLLLLSPIVIGADINMDMFDLIFFRTGIIILFMASLIDTPKRVMPVWVNKIVFGFMGLCIFNIFIHTFAPCVMSVTMNLFLSIIGIYITYTYLDKTDLTKYILLAGAINLIFLLFQRIGFDPIFDQIPQSQPYLAGAFLGNAPRLGTYFALIIPFMYVLSLPLAIIVSLLIGQYVMLIPIAILLYTRDKSRGWKLLIGGFSLASIFILHKHIWFSLVLRFNNTWKPGLTYFFDRLLIGYGLGAKVGDTFGIISTSYIQFLLGAGILGLVWLGYLFKKLKFDDSRESIALFSLLVIMFFEYPVELTRCWYLIIAIIVMYLLKQDKELI